MKVANELNELTGWEQAEQYEDTKKGLVNKYLPNWFTPEDISGRVTEVASADNLLQQKICDSLHEVFAAEALREITSQHKTAITKRMAKECDRLVKEAVRKKMTQIEKDFKKKERTLTLRVKELEHSVAMLQEKCNELQASLGKRRRPKRRSPSRQYSEDIRPQYRSTGADRRARHDAKNSSGTSAPVCH